ncbi:MAG TPA: SRPBCC family protein, partial [Candidatus Limnocylindrales bacterium]|nr:SRPBCC family protein [Candidatus Limnocylindrales bacterium]
MAKIEKSIDVDVPVREAYNQWTQFESFPQFMEGVERVVQTDDKTLEWTASIAGKVKNWRAEI